MKYSTEFLTKLSLQQHQIKYAKITALDINEQAEESIEGAITSGGPISIDGASALRRTCNLTIAVEKKDTKSGKPAAAITDAYWGLTHKFKLEIGLKNSIDSSYPNIIWLNQGTYVIKSFSISYTNTHLNINISGQDKMSKLNGDIGGLFPTQTTLNTIKEIAKDGSITYVKQHIRDIIRNMVHELGGEPWQNIIIEDLPDYGYELWNYIGTNSNGEEMPMYFFRDGTTKQIKNMTINQNMEVYRLYNPATLELWKVQENFATGQIEIFDASGLYSSKITQQYKFMLKEILDSELYRKIGNNEFNTGIQLALTENKDGKKYYIQKIRQGDIAGYHRTALIYPGDLIANTGETITSVLDKIKNLLGEFEYFYDVDGKFIFRKKKTYVNNLFSPISNNNTIEAFTQISQYSYEFKDDQLLSSISLSPSIGDVKNDFTIWGNKKAISGDKLPIHARYAVDKKPEKYTTFPYYKKCFNMTYIVAHPLYQYFNETGYIILTSNPKGNLEMDTSPSADNESGYILLIEEKDNKIKNKKPDNACDSVYVLESNIYRIATFEEEIDEGIEKFYIEKVALNNGGDLYLLNEDKTDLIKKVDANTEIKYYLKKNNLFIYQGTPENYYPESLDETYYLAEDSTDYYAFDSSKENNVDWRELIYLMARDYYQHNQDPNYNIKLYNNNSEYGYMKNNKTTGYEVYYADMQAFWRELYNPNGKSPQYIIAGEAESDKYLYWSRNVLYYPESLNFWIDFLDTGGQIDKYSVSQIGRRQKIEQDSASGVTAIFYKETPDVEFIVMPTESIDIDHNDQVHTPIFIQDNMKQLFTISSRGKASNERIDELVWKHVCIAGGANITCIPLYFLDVNTRIKYKDEDYIVSKISLPVTYNGMMQLTLSKIIKPI